MLKNDELLTLLKTECCEKRSEIHLGRRAIFVISMIQDFIIKEFNQVVTDSLRQLLLSSVKEGNENLFPSKWDVVVKLRVYQDEISLILPLELVNEFASNLLKKEQEHIIEEPTEEMLTAFSYLIVRVISKIRSQKVYLCSVKSASSQEISMKNKYLISYIAKTRIGEFNFSVVLNNSLLQRIKIFSKYDVSLLNDERIWQKIIIPANINLNLKILEIKNIFHLKQSQIIPVDMKSISAVLVTKTKENTDKEISLKFYGFIRPNKFQFSF
ncbi:MAG: hypothetical protein KBC84_03470 [Proteobacteria bacterium]|nr:hypothetical protein [Pseudomonadota bacterium]